MVSKKIFPLNQRLDAQQLNALEGFSVGNKTHMGIKDYSSMLLWYHKALEAAEKELTEARKDIDDLRDEVNEMIK